MNDSDELPFIVQELSPRFQHVSLRGQGAAAFVFAQHNGRAVEISENEDGWWLEFWEASPDPDAAPVREVTLPTSRDAIKEANDWLAGRRLQAQAP